VLKAELHATSSAEIHELRGKQPNAAEIEASTERYELRGMEIAAELPLSYAVHDLT